MRRRPVPLRIVVAAVAVALTTTGLIGPPTLPMTGSGLAEKKNS